MPYPSKPIVVAVLLGPTAIGKSTIAVEIAPSLQAEVVSLDSMQVYRGMDIGTAKARTNQRRFVPHHMLDVVEPAINYSAAEYQEAARRSVEEIARRGFLPFLVGGTGLYLEAVVFDIRFPPGSIDDPLRYELEEWAVRDPVSLRKSLKVIDPKFASTEGYANMRRVIRAMEIYKRTGLLPSDLMIRRGEQPLFYPYVGAALNAPRQLLHRLIDSRVDRMVEEGLVEEVKELASGKGLSHTARQALGYKEILEYLDSNKTLEETVYNIKERSRRYAKRQLTWFRRIPGLRWFELQEEDYTEGLSRISIEICDYLKDEIDRRKYDE
jgi:tRNA dimethylallyltransferase